MTKSFDDKQNSVIKIQVDGSNDVKKVYKLLYFDHYAMSIDSIIFEDVYINRMIRCNLDIWIGEIGNLEGSTHSLYCVENLL
jgi:hypothetical protein